MFVQMPSREDWQSWVTYFRSRLPVEDGFQLNLANSQHSSLLFEATRDTVKVQLEASFLNRGVFKKKHDDEGACKAIETQGSKLGFFLRAQLASQGNGSYRSPIILYADYPSAETDIWSMSHGRDVRALLDHKYGNCCQRGESE